MSPEKTYGLKAYKLAKKGKEKEAYRLLRSKKHTIYQAYGFIVAVRDGKSVDECRDALSDMTMWEGSEG